MIEAQGFEGAEFSIGCDELDAGRRLNFADAGQGELAEAPGDT
jgi:hypothetical protein